MNFRRSTPSGDGRGRGRTGRDPREDRGGRRHAGYRDDDRRDGRSRSFRDDRGPREERRPRDDRGGREQWRSRDDRTAREQRGPRDARGPRADRWGRDDRGPRDDRGSRDRDRPGTSRGRYGGTAGFRRDDEGRGRRDGYGPRAGGRDRDFRDRDFRDRDYRDRDRDLRDRDRDRGRADHDRPRAPRVPTIGEGGGSRGRHGRRGARGPARDTRWGSAGGDRYGARGAGRGDGRRAFKGAGQPIRDPDFYPEGYTDERDTTEVPDGIRLQKVLAAAGVASRRACEELIGEGRVTVDGQVVRRFGARVDPEKQVIHVDGKRVPTSTDLVYFAVNKPIGVVSTMSDPEGRPSLGDYVLDRPERLFHVGRLDTDTEGLIILTNDGELAHRLTHPSFGVRKKYWAKVPGPIPRDLPRRMTTGIELEDGVAKADEFKVVQEHGQQALVEIVLHEGRKHIVRRMLDEVGHRVIDLARIEFGPVRLGRLKPGTIRALTVTEVGELYAAVGL